MTSVMTVTTLGADLFDQITDEEVRWLDELNAKATLHHSFQVDVGVPVARLLAGSRRALWVM